MGMLVLMWCTSFSLLCMHIGKTSFMERLYVKFPCIENFYVPHVFVISRKYINPLTHMKLWNLFKIQKLHAINILSTQRYSHAKGYKLILCMK